MNSFYHPQHGILIAPNKCASTTLQSTIPNNRIILGNHLNSQHLSADLVWHVVVRDPVAWYVSGYRYSAAHLVNQAREMNYKPDSFESHLEYCISQRDALLDAQPSQFDIHTWFNPVDQTARLLKKHHLPITRVNKYIKLENQARFEKIIVNFADGNPVKTANVTSEKITYKPFARSIAYPTLNDRSIDLIKQLDNWSYRCGYNLEHSIESYSNVVHT
jgi:hypothetical protein|tara:strand:- start:210 stop:863 length:654 start_codon:yes stop_codon:yes gene_type:complete